MAPQVLHRAYWANSTKVEETAQGSLKTPLKLKLWRLPNMEKTISFRLELELAKAFKIALIQRGETAQAVLEKAVREYIKN